MTAIIVYNIILLFAITALMLLFSCAIGWDYSALKRLSNSAKIAENAYGILGPTSCLCFLDYLFNLALGPCIGISSLSSLLSNSWISVGLYYCLVLIASLGNKGNSRKYKASLFARAVFGTLLALYFAAFLLGVDINRLAPNIEDVVFQFWFLVAIVILSIISIPASADINYEALFYEVDGIAKDYYPQRYLDDDILRALYCSFGMIEAYYRPKPIRRLEMLASRMHIAKTTGIMQVKSKETLSDEESVKKAFDIVEGIWDRFLLAVSDERVDGAPIVAQDSDGYEYRLLQMKDCVVSRYRSLHLLYMGSSKFPGASKFFQESFNCIYLQLFQPREKTIRVNCSTNNHNMDS